MTKEIVLVPVSKNIKDWTIPMIQAALIFGEARNQMDLAKIGVAFVVVNRVKKGGWFGTTHKKVMLKRKQFSCFNRFNVNYKKLLNPLKYETAKVWIKCWEIAQETLAGRFYDPTDGATHYHDRSLDSNPPSWTKKLKFKTRIGSFSFYG